MEVCERAVDGGEVLLDDFLAALAVGFLDGFLDRGDGLVFGQDAADGEEAGLHDRIDPHAHARFLGHVVGVNDVKFDLLVDDLPLNLFRQMVPRRFRRPEAVEQEHRAVGGVAEHVVLLEEDLLVACDEVCRADQASHPDRLRSKPQMADRHCPGLLRVVDEVALGEIVGIVADDLDRVLVRPDGSVRSQAVEHGPHDLVAFDVEGGIVVDAGVRHVVVDADGEMILGGVLGEFIEDALDHSGGDFLARQPVASADDLHVPTALDHGVDGVEVKRLAGRSRLLGAIHRRDDLRARRQCIDEMGDTERPIEADLDHADLLAGGDEVVDGLVGDLGRRTHHHDHALGVGCSDVIEEVIGPSDLCGEFVHRLLHDLGSLLVERVHRLAALEVDVGVLGGAANRGPVGVHRAAAVGDDHVVVDHCGEVRVGKPLDLADLVAGAEAVEEVYERHAGLERRGVRDQPKVADLLDAVRGEQPEAGLTDRHHVAVVAEDRQRLACQRAGRDVKDRGRQFAGDLVHRGDHQQQALAGGKRRA